MKKNLKGIGFYLILFALVLGIVYMFFNFQEPTAQKTYSDLITAIKDKEVTQLTVSDTKAVAVLKKDKNADSNAPATVIQVDIPSALVFDNHVGHEILAQVQAGTLKYNVQHETGTPWWISLIPLLGTILIIVFFWVVFMRQSQGGGGGKMMSFGKSKAKVNTATSKKVTFDDVAGADEEKAELEEIVDFLKKPAKFVEMGARIPKGVLLVGPPGTGKTLLAKAVSGEAGVPFFSISGSDFVEMFVGVGASRVRDLFEQAKKDSPSIVFIDEIDAVGRHRGAGLGGGHVEII